MYVQCTLNVPLKIKLGTSIWVMHDEHTWSFVRNFVLFILPLA